VFYESLYQRSFILQWIKPKKIDFEPRHRKKGRSKAGKHEKRKQGFIGEQKRDDIRRNVKQRQQQKRSDEQAIGRKTEGKGSVLDRFKKKAG
jgi:hypothetical protein